MGLWKDKSAVICGGSSGLGFCLASELVRQQAKLVVLLARDTAKLESAVQQLSNLAKELGSTCAVESVAVDLCKSESTMESAQRIRSLVGELDLVVQCVGVSDRGSIAQLSSQRLHQLVDLNVVTSLHAIQCYSPLLSQAEGVIVLIGSLSSLFAPRFLGGYSMAKHALAALAQQARLELAEVGTHVMLCCPGPIDRPDAGSRYFNHASLELPSDALEPGGGARLVRLNPTQLSQQILRAANQRKPLLILPKKARWLRLISAISQVWGDWLLKKRST